MPDLDVFSMQFLRKITVIFEISNLEFVMKVFLTNTVNFVIGSTFSKDPLFLKSAL